MKSLVITFFLFIFLSSFSQRRVEGTIIDEKSLQPIPYADVYVKDHSLGTIANEDGRFILIIPKHLENGVLEISCLGFSHVYIDLDKKKDYDFGSIFLSPVNIELGEVILSGSKESALQIVSKALDKYDSDLDNNPHVSEGFLRHTERTDKELKWIVEAKIEKFDPGGKNTSDKIKINVDSVFKSYDKRNIDTITVYRLFLEEVKKKKFKDAWKKNISVDEISSDDLRNAIQHHDTYHSIRGNKGHFFSNLFMGDIDKIRNHNDGKSTFHPKNLKNKFHFSIKGIIDFKGNEVYKIKISYPKKNFRKYWKNTIPFGWIFIKKDDYSILKFEFTELLLSRNNNQILKKLTGTDIKYHIKVKYREIDKKMYPIYMNYKQPKKNRSFNDILGSHTDEVYYYLEEEIVYYNIIRDRDKISDRLSKKWDPDIFYLTPVGHGQEIFPTSKSLDSLLKGIDIN